VPYDFNETDFRISMALISTYLTKAQQVSGGGGGGGMEGWAEARGLGPTPCTVLGCSTRWLLPWLAAPAFTHRNHPTPPPHPRHPRLQAGEEALPWGTLRYLIGEAMYGGRVSDGFDRRVLTTYLEEYLGDFLFDAHRPFSLFSDGQGLDIGVPRRGAREVRSSGWLERLARARAPLLLLQAAAWSDRALAAAAAAPAPFSSAAALLLPQVYIRALEALPLAQSPEVFGLHANADISYYSAATKALWADLVDLQPRAGAAGGGASREDFIGAMTRYVGRRGALLRAAAPAASGAVAEIR
jgi:hypothetical protein